ncbi:carboxypeptidase-like regulatory domain-containing protein [Aquimarina sp. ERC-38]|uniref:TonB-dependent receptor n=1 Tax=Aquimarina sp. ERC-38 TaxID=2949996 RepID=UPI002247C5C5|nr:TonB-dependent receptor [Aquimarina sp. ERC-38]UZO81585.1 carboxypeptidase-like regulatory domain-containing protein [Aquimarina sp. ERC-38]
MRNLLSLCALFVVGILSAQETGSISGALLDKEANNQPLPFANVLIKGTTKGTTTDFDGLYTIENLEPGTYILEFSFVGYQSIEKEATVEAGKTTTINESLGASAAALDEVIIKTTVKKESEAAILLEQKNAVTIQQKIGAQELAKKGVSDVATGLTKATGISKESNKLYVRGLGDRYNNAYLNGLPIPSLDPSLKLIDLGIFPTDIVENLGIFKTYSAALYGDFAGASVNIDAKNRPGKDFLEVNFSSGINTNAVGNDFFLLDGGNYDQWGLDDGSRRVPIFLDIPNYNYVSTDIDYYPFDTSFNPRNRFNAPDGGFGITGGKTFKFGEDNNRKLDVLFTASFSQGHETALNGLEAAFNTEGDAITGIGFVEQADRYRYKTNTTALASIGYRFNSNHSIASTTLLVNDTQDELREFTAQSKEDTDVIIKLRRGTYEQNTLFTQQLTGTHQFKENKYEINWGASYNDVLGLIPDRRQLIFTETNNGFFIGDATSPDFANNQRFYQQLDEIDYSGKVNFEWNFNKNEEEVYTNKASFGIFGRIKDRDFEANQLNYNILNINNIDVDFNNPDALLSEANFLDGTFTVLENLNPTRIYEADFSNFGGFSAIQYAFNEKLTANAGIRLELFEQNIFYRLLEDLETDPFRQNTIDETFILPSFDVKYAINEFSNFRFAASKTVTLPKFTEVAPFLYEDVTESTLGNPELQNSDNYNVDLKWEYFPEQSGEVISASIFGKYLDNPIEKIGIASATNNFSFGNTNEAIIFGLELEYKKNIGKLFQVEDTPWNNVNFGINTTLLHSEVKVDTDILINNSSVAATNSERQLQGASPYLINTDVSYVTELKNQKITAGLDFNFFGDRIYAAGSNGRGDIFEKGFGVLNFNFKDEVGEHLEISFKARNLLNPDIIRYQDQENLGEELDVYRYDRGLQLSLGITFKL